MARRLASTIKPGSRSDVPRTEGDLAIATAAPPRARTTDDGQRFVLRGVNWKVYNAILGALGDRPIRLTYDRGNLELMSPSHAHESGGYLLGRMIEILSLELDIPIKGGGSTTFRREDLDRGLEPDECYWIANQPRIAGEREIDLAIEPPPDLAIKVDITSSSLDRQGIYTALGVARALAVRRLDFDHPRPPGPRHVCPTGGQPLLPVPADGRGVLFLHEGESAHDETPWIRSFRDWIRAD
ncbi:MAG TPA: Uma2 family endonuclease [Isosphaeraceae bacterium]|jgi:Uma2 family endonuclease|nr:Uma2 family endonuclease [Isosphaeraceae bacterium]